MEQGIAAVGRQRARIVGTSLTACKAPRFRGGKPDFHGGKPDFHGGRPDFRGGKPRPYSGLRDFAGLASLPDYFEQQYARGDGHIEAFNPTEHWDADQLIAQAAGQTP